MGAAAAVAIITAFLGLIGGTTAGVLNYLGNKETNETNEENVESTNETNKEIQESVNTANTKSTTQTNLMNYLINKMNNQANAEMVEQTNKVNYMNQLLTNEANKQIAQDTNQANIDIADAANAANERIYQGVNDTNLAIANAINELNKGIADENLAFQREKYEYDKALQQQLFEREDTSYQRTAADMAAAGLNPLSMAGTNGSGAVVSTLAPQSNMVYQGATMQPHDQVVPTVNGYQMSPFVAQAGRYDKTEFKAAQRLATKMESFQKQMYSYEWLNTMAGNIQDMALSSLNHGLQVDQLNEVKKNNQVDRMSKLLNMGYVPDDEGYRMLGGHDKDGNYYNPISLRSMEMLQHGKSLKHDIDYGLFNNSSAFERNITGIQYMIDNKRIESLGHSLWNEANDIFGLMQKLYNK